MICIATFNSYTTFNLKVYSSNTPYNLAGSECAEFEVKRFTSDLKGLYRRNGFKYFYKKLKTNDDFSTIMSFNDLKLIVMQCRNMDIADDYNYKYVFLYNNGRIKLISRVQIDNMYFVPNKKAVYYLDTFYYKIPLDISLEHKCNLMYSIMAKNINKCALNMNLCNEQLVEFNPAGLFLTVSSCSGIKSTLKFIKYSNMNLSDTIKVLKKLKFNSVCKTDNFITIDYEGIDYVPLKTEYCVLMLAKSRNIDNTVDLVKLLTSADAQRLYAEEYNYIENIGLGLVWDGLISKPEDIKYMNDYDILTLIKDESVKDTLMEKVKQNKKAERIIKKTQMPVLFDALGNIIM